jgi:hypothetical protein
MYLDWTTLLLLCLAGVTAWFWQDSLAARENANVAALDACERLGLQFLDGTVAFARLRLGRNANGRLCLRRTYLFDYTADSIERRQGFIVVDGRRVETVGYAQDEQRRDKARMGPPPQPAGEPTRVLHLEDWRARARSDRSAVGKPPEG